MKGSASITAGASLTFAGALLASGAGGCRQIAPGDAGAADVEAEAPMPKCASTTPFDPPTPLDSSINSASDDSDIHFTPDELVAYFASRRDSPYGDMFVATRSAISQPFGAPSKVAGMAGAYEGPEAPNVTSDQLDLLFFAGACSVALGSASLCGASRASMQESFGAPSAINVALGVKQRVLGSPYVTSDGLRLYVDAEFAPSSDGIATAIRATRNDDFGSIAPVAVELGDAGGDWPGGPVVTPDELTLFFSRAVSGGIWMAARTSTDTAFTGARELTEIDGMLPVSSKGLAVYPTWISPDGCRLYLTVSIPTDDAGGSQTDIYVASRSP